jgi:hypothetical protein
LRYIKQYLDQDSSAIFVDILKKRRPLTAQSKTWLNILIKMANNNKAQQLERYSEIAKTIIHLLIQPIHPVISIFYKNALNEYPASQVAFFRQEEAEFKICLGMEHDFSIHDVNEFYTKIAYIMDCFVQKTPPNHHCFVSIKREASYINLIEDLPLLPTTFTQDYINRFPHYNTWFVNYVFEQYQQYAPRVAIINGKPEYLTRKFTLTVTIPPERTIARILRAESQYIRQETS